jgi:hypothetical protein
VRWLKNCDKAEPRELAGEPNTAAVGCVAAWAIAKRGTNEALEQVA